LIIFSFQADEPGDQEMEDDIGPLLETGFKGKFMKRFLLILNSANFSYFLA